MHSLPGDIGMHESRALVNVNEALRARRWLPNKAALTLSGAASVTARKCTCLVEGENFKWQTQTVWDVWLITP